MMKDGRGKRPAPVTKTPGKRPDAVDRGKSLDEDVRNEILSVIGTNLREARAKRGLSQIELSEASGVSQKHISQIECGRRNLTALTMQNLAKAVGVAVRDLLPRSKR